MKKALIVAAHGELRQAIYEALMNCDFDDVIVTDRVDFAREQISECEIVYINFPLSGNQETCPLSHSPEKIPQPHSKKRWRILKCLSSANPQLKLL